VKTSIIVAPLSNHVPHLIIDFDPAVVGASAHELRVRLATATPAIEINPQTGSATPNQDLPAMPNALVIYLYLLRPGDEAIVGQQIRKVLKSPKSVGTDDAGMLPRKVWPQE
jgi:L-seryl-tRNA(Ser) seleniumtransferase